MAAKVKPMLIRRGILPPLPWEEELLTIEAPVVDAETGMELGDADQASFVCFLFGKRVRA